MATKPHATLAGADLHEPKGIASATAKSTYVADGAGSGTWSNAFGDVSADTFLLNTAVWEDLTLSGSQGKVIGANAPAEDVLVGGIKVFQFSASALNELFFQFQLPHSYKAGTDIYPHVHWAPSTTNTGNVIWGLEYTIANIGDTIPSETTITVTDAADGTALKHQVTSFAAIDGTSCEASTMLICRVYRDGAAGGDTFTGVANLLAVDIHYEKNTLGTATEF